jgi:hypothetical protein
MDDIALAIAKKDSEILRKMIAWIEDHEKRLQKLEKDHAD